jgi:hypothetical protein
LALGAFGNGVSTGGAKTRGLIKGKVTVGVENSVTRVTGSAYDSVNASIALRNE